MHAPVDETRTLAQARAGGEFRLGAGHSYTLTVPDRAPSRDEIYVVVQAFVEFSENGHMSRWFGPEHHGSTLSLRDDVTLELLELGRDASEDRIELLSDLRIAGLGVTRWQLMSAPHGIELDPELERRLARLRQG